MSTAAHEAPAARAWFPRQMGGAAGGVFSVNLIRGRGAPLWLRRALIAATFAYVILQSVMCLALLGTAFYANRSTAALRAILGPQLEAASLEDLGASMSQLQQQAGGLAARLGAAAAHQAGRFPLAGKLAACVRTVPPRTWIVEITGDAKARTLILRAEFLPEPDAPHALPVKAWVDALRADPVFGRGLQELAMSASSRSTRGRATVFWFELAGRWSE